MRRLRVWIVVVALSGSTVAAFGAARFGVVLARGHGAQSLAEVARAEEARRKTTRKAAKVYTNGDLQPDPRSAQPLPAAPAGLSPVPPADMPAAEPAAEPPPDPQRDEQYWRTRMTAAREQLERSQLFAEALQSRVNALTTDFVNRDDPAQQTVIGADRDKALAELDRVQGEIRDLTRGIAEIEEEARRAGVPPGWLR